MNASITSQEPLIFLCQLLILFSAFTCRVAISHTYSAEIDDLLKKNIVWVGRGCDTDVMFVHINV